MRRHSRWAVAAVAAVLTLVLASDGNARIHRRAHGNTHRVTSTAAPTPATSSPTPSTSSSAPSTAAGMRSNDAAAGPQPALSDGGKGGISVAAIDPRDVVVDREGRPRAAIIDFGGFLGVGSRKIAVDWGVLKFAHDKDKGDVITVELTRDQVKAAPEFKEGSSLVVLGPSGAAAPSPAPQPQAQDKPQAQE